MCSMSSLWICESNHGIEHISIWINANGYEDITVMKTTTYTHMDKAGCNKVMIVMKQQPMLNMDQKKVRTKHGRSYNRDQDIYGSAHIALSPYSNQNRSKNIRRTKKP